MLQDAFSQLTMGWSEMLPEIAQGSQAWPKPHAIHVRFNILIFQLGLLLSRSLDAQIDFLGGGFVVESTKQALGPNCKILLWWSCPLGCMPAHLTEYDFMAIAAEIYSDEARRQGRTMDQILDQVGS
jgi:hypothetical protein